MLKVGVIGVGNCGGQIAAKVAAELKFDAVVINTSDQDLEKVKGDNVKIFPLGDKKGAGQDRSTAKLALKDAIQVVIEDLEFKTFISSQEKIFIIGSTGGGTGSGIGPLLYHLVNQMTTAQVTIVGILPTLGEDRGIQVNTLNYLNEIYNTMTDTRYMLFDNNKYSNLSSVKMMEGINSDVVESIRILSGYYASITSYASIDEKDMLTLTSPAGRIVTASAMDVTEKDLDTTTIEDMIIHDLKTNSHCEIDRDGAVANTGIITNLSSKINDTFDMNIPKISEFIGEATGTGFKHIGINNESSLPNNIIFIASGLSPINDRIEKINARIKELDEKASKRATASALENSKLDSNMEKESKTLGSVDVSAAFEQFGV